MRYPCSMSDEASQARHRRRAGMEVRVFRPGDEEAAADYDALYWDRIPIDERAEFAWTLSVELWQLSHPEEVADGTERRSARSVARVHRR